MDKFFTQESCDRCGVSLDKGRTMSMFTTECICMECKRAEQGRSDYREALDTERAECQRGNRNFEGIGLK